MKFMNAALAAGLLTWSAVSPAEVYKCDINGQLHYRDTPCPHAANKNSSRERAFDGWFYGTHISEMKREARRRQLAMSPGTSAFGSQYNAKIINQRPDAREYTYRTELMGKRVTVTLYFTKSTQLLYKVKNTIHLSSDKPEERKYFYESLYRKLSNQYGKPKDIQTEAAATAAQQNPLADTISNSVANILVGTLKAWGLETNQVVTLSYKKRYELMSSYRLTYLNKRLNATNDREISAEIKRRTNKAFSSDANRL